MKSIYAILIVIISAAIFYFSALESQASPPKMFAYEITEELSGVIEIETDDGGLIIALPSYFDHELVEMKIRGLIRKYDDVSVAKPWHKVDDSKQLYLMVVDDLMIIKHLEKIKKILIVYEN